MPFWDETSKETLESGVPWAFTVENVEIGGKTVRNPLRSYTFPRGVCDPEQDPGSWSYSKPKGYETVRYPFSGIVHPEEAKAAAGASVPGRPVLTLHCPLTAIFPAADAHNAKLQNMNTDDMLNQNVVAWMTDGFREKDFNNVGSPIYELDHSPHLRTHTLPAPVADGRHWRRCHVPQVPPSAYLQRLFQHDLGKLLPKQAQGRRVLTGGAAQQHAPGRRRVFGPQGRQRGRGRRHGGHRQRGKRRHGGEQHGSLLPPCPHPHPSTRTSFERPLS